MEQSMLFCLYESCLQLNALGGVGPFRRLRLAWKVIPLNLYEIQILNSAYCPLSLPSVKIFIPLLVPMRLAPA